MNKAITTLRNIAPKFEYDVRNAGRHSAHCEVRGHRLYVVQRGWVCGVVTPAFGYWAVNRIDGGEVVREKCETLESAARFLCGK